ncbi:MAG TPA: universal stress protein [Acidimicrobiales bacterium]|nr:universal stress protein [Acidimicrobiales bacterium]
MIGTIVVGIDGSATSKAALGWAARQAEKTGATLVAVNSWGPIFPVGIDPEEKARKDLMKELVQVLGTEGAGEVRLVLSEDAPGHLLVHEAADADLLVVGSHGHGRGTLAGTVLGSVSEYCLQHAKCPVAVVRIPEQG